MSEKNKELTEKEAMEICQYYIKYGEEATLKKYDAASVEDALTK